MKIKFSIVVLIVILIGLRTQSQAQIKLMSAKIINKKDSSIVVGAHIVNLNTMNATNSYSDGTFLMPFTQGDTLRFSHIGFSDKYIFTNDLLIPDAIQITIFMSEVSIMLDTASIMTYRSKEEFANEFTNKEIESKPEEVFKYDGPNDLEDVETDLNAHVPLGSPITFLYNKFSKQAKEKKRHQKAKIQNDREETIKARYNIAVVKEVTGITSDDEAKAFMKKCPLDDDYVYKATDYDIVKSILECQKNNQ